MATQWHNIAAELAAECPSHAVRHATIKVLERAEVIGPLRSPYEEFRRVFRFLLWNEPDRVLDIVNTILARSKGEHPQTTVRANAWGYIVGVLDEWITHARIFYLISGILESTLRARLDAHLTDKLDTPDWPDVAGAAPSGLHEFAARDRRDAQLARIHELLESTATATAFQQEQLIAELRKVLAPEQLTNPRRGATFVRELTFGGLRMFFEKKKTWTGKTQLQDIFRGRDGTATPPLREKVSSVLKTLNDARNEVAHYRPSHYLTFEQPLFNAALLASWLGEDIQHIYSSIDTRSSTELSNLLGPLADEAGWATRLNGSRCSIDECAIEQPYDWLMASAPTVRDNIKAVIVRRCCAFHRVQTRVAIHRP